MAPYDPPTNVDYSEIDVSKYEDRIILSLIGRGGCGFYQLTSILGLRYLWWNQDKKVIELWGDHDILLKGVPILKTIIENYVPYSVK